MTREEAKRRAELYSALAEGKGDSSTESSNKQMGVLRHQ